MRRKYAYVLGGSAGANALVDTDRWPESDFKRFVNRNDATLISLDDLPASGLLPARIASRHAAITILKALLAIKVAFVARRYDAIVCSGEDIGVPVANAFRIFGRETPLVVITHGPQLPNPTFRRAFDKVKALPFVRFACLSSSLRTLLIERYGVPERNAIDGGYGIDTDFFAATSPPAGRLIASAGVSHRDYPTLLAAISDLDVTVKIAASSRWVGAGQGFDGELPGHVEMRSWGNYSKLRGLYESAALIVVPTVDAPSAKGLAVIGEALAMGRPVIATGGTVTSDFIADGVNGLVVPSGQPAAMREAIVRLLGDGDALAAMGARAAASMRERFSLGAYCARLEAIAEGMIASAAKPAPGDGSTAAG